MSQRPTERPANMTAEHVRYLDYLRESGISNMLLALPYLKRHFKTLEAQEARDILYYWRRLKGETNEQRD